MPLNQETSQYIYPILITPISLIMPFRRLLKMNL